MKKLLYLLPLVAISGLSACQGSSWESMTREKFDERIAGVEDTSGCTKITASLDLTSTGYAYNSSSGTVIPTNEHQSKDCEFNLVEGEWQCEDPSDVYVLNEIIDGTLNHYATSIAPDLDYCTFSIYKNGKKYKIECIWDGDDVEGGAPYHIHQEFHYYWDQFGRMTSLKIYSKKTHDLTGVVEGYTTIVSENTQFAQYHYE